MSVAEPCSLRCAAVRPDNYDGTTGRGRPNTSEGVVETEPMNPLRNIYSAVLLALVWSGSNIPASHPHKTPAMPRRYRPCDGAVGQIPDSFVADFRNHT